ncbi:MAG: hypothetical protein ABW176_00590 [Candidatus Thiodiazotropha endolucinida]
MKAVVCPSVFPGQEDVWVSGLGFLLKEKSCLAYGHTEDGGDAQSRDSKNKYR